MVEMMNTETSHWWWFDSHNKGSKRSPWLQSTLNELDEKTKVMLKLIEEDADSFAQRAEMYYKKRPELINLVEEFYRVHRSLAERYDLVKSDHGTRLLTTFGSPFIAIEHHKPEKLTRVMDQTYNCYSEKLTSAMDQTYNSYSVTSDTEEYAESEVDDPEQDVEFQIEKEINEVEDPDLANEIHVDEEIKEDEHPEREEEIQFDQETKQDVISSEVYDVEIMKLREEIERLRGENNMQKDQLMQKDEEKREVIRQLSVSVGVLKDENLKLRKYIARESPKKCSPFEFCKLKGGFLGKFFIGSPNSQAIVSTQ